MNRRNLKVAAAILATLLLQSVGRADRRELVVSPSDTGIGAFPGLMDFAHDWNVGCALEFSGSRTRVFSFLLDSAIVTDDVDLSADFGVRGGAAVFPVISMAVHARTGLVVIFGRAADGTQRVVALNVDTRGTLERRWVATFPISPALPGPFDLTIDANGSRVFYSYFEFGTGIGIAADAADGPTALRHFLRSGSLWVDGPISRSPAGSTQAATRQLAMIDAPTGNLLDTLLMPSLGFASLLYHAERNRLLALAGGVLSVIDTGHERLDVETTIPPFEAGSTLTQAQGVDATGRFLIAYDGFNSAGNTYVSYDLDLKGAQGFAVPGNRFPDSNGITFVRQTASLIAPMTARFIPEESAFVIGGQRESDILTVGTDGSIALSSRFKLPMRSEPSTRNFLAPASNAEISESGQIGFLAATNGRLFAFDARSGEIVGDDEMMDPSLFGSIRLVQPRNLLLLTRGDNRLSLLDFTPAPRIDAIRVSKKSTRIKGSLFLAGARLLLNGVDLGVADRDPDKPGREILLDRGRKDFPAGQEFTFTVVNRDGLASPPFIFRR